jgi:hypothetical protein
MFAVAVPGLLLGGFYLWYGWRGYLAGPTLFFPAYRLFWLTVGYGFIAILLTGVGLVIAWIVQAARGQALSAWSWLAVLITFAAEPGDHAELVANEAARALAIQVNGRTLANFRV